MSTLRALLRDEPVTVESAMTVRQAADVLREHRVAVAPVMQRGRAVGVVWQDDLAMLAPIEPDRRPMAPMLERVLVEDVMCALVPSLSADAEVGAAECLLRLSGDRHLLVMDGDLLVGFVSEDQLAPTRAD